MTTLTARKRYRGPPAPPHLVTDTSYAVGRKTLVPGMRVRIRGERGAVFTFISATLNTRTGAEWITVAGGKDGVVMFRAFRPERIAKVLPPLPPRTKGASRA